MPYPADPNSAFTYHLRSITNCYLRCSADRARPTQSTVEARELLRPNTIGRPGILAGEQPIGGAVRHRGARQRCRPPVHPTGETRMSLPIGRDRAAPTHPVLTEVTERLIARSVSARAGYLDRVTEAASAAPARTDLGCSNLAHGFAA